MQTKYINYLNCDQNDLRTESINNNINGSVFSEHFQTIKTKNNLINWYNETESNIQDSKSKIIEYFKKIIDEIETIKNENLLYIENIEKENQDNFCKIVYKLDKKIEFLEKFNKENQLNFNNNSYADEIEIISKKKKELEKLPKFDIITEPLKLISINFKEGGVNEILSKTINNSIDIQIEEFIRYFNNNYLLITHDKVNLNYEQYAFSNKLFKSPEKFPRVKNLLCFDLKSLPKNYLSKIKILGLHSVDKELEIGSIPSSTKILHLHNGFNQIIKRDIISNIKELHICDIEKPLQEDSIPPSVKSLYIHNGFKHSIKKEFLPPTIQELHLYDIVIPIESLPNSITKLYFHNDFNHEISIPHGVEELYVYKVGQPLKSGSIPSSVKLLSFQNNYNYLIEPELIPKTVEKLYLHSINLKSLVYGSIPRTIKSLHLSNGFSIQLTKGLIPHGIMVLHIGNIGFNALEKGSVPNSIVEVHLKDGYNIKLDRYILPSSVKKLHIHDIKQPILSNCLPKSIEQIYIHSNSQLKINNLKDLSNLPSLKTIYLNDNLLKKLDKNNLFNQHFSKPISISSLKPF